MKQKFKSYAFCLGVCVAVVGVIVAIGNALGFKVNEVAITSVLTAILGVLVSLGVVVKEPDETLKNENSSEKGVDEENPKCHAVFIETAEGSDDLNKNK